MTRSLTVLKALAIAVALAVTLGVVVNVSAKTKSAVGVITSYRAPTKTKGGQATIAGITFRFAKGSTVPTWVKKGAKAKVFYKGSGKVRDILNTKKGTTTAARIQNLTTGVQGTVNDAGDCNTCGGGGGGGGT